MSNFMLVIAPLAMLAAVGAAGLTCLSIALAGIQALRGRWAPARRIALAALLVPIAYGGVLLGLGVASRDRTVPPGRQKYFCEVDCHIAYSVVGVDSPRTLAGTAPRQGRFVLVTLRVHFDRATIGPHRPDTPLAQSPRSLSLVDAGGRSYAPSAAAQAALIAAHGEQKPLTLSLRPGESYLSAVAFDVPASATGLRLLVVEADWPPRLLWGHETAPLHAKTYLALPAA